MLIEALSSWQYDVPDGMMGALFGAMLADSLDDEGKAKLKQDEDERCARRKDELAMREERSIMLKAKLLAIKDGIVADGIVSDVCGRK